MQGLAFFTFLAASAMYLPAVAANGWISVESSVFNEDGSVNRTLAGPVTNTMNRALARPVTNTTLEKRVGTEVISCYNMGTKIDRAPAISVIDDWCNNHAIGQFVASGQTISARYYYGAFTVLVSGAPINNCGPGFTVDGNCNRLLRLPLDGCNTGGENGKQGGYETDLCGTWRFDPGVPGNDY